MYHGGPHSTTIPPTFSVAAVGPQPAVVADPLLTGAVGMQTTILDGLAAVANLADDAGLQLSDADDFLRAAGVDFFDANEPPVTSRASAASDSPSPYDSLSYVSLVSNTPPSDVRNGSI